MLLGRGEHGEPLGLHGPPLLASRRSCPHHLRNTRPDTIANCPGIGTASGCAFPGQATLVCAPRLRNACGTPAGTLGTRMEMEPGGGRSRAMAAGGPSGARSCSCSASAQEAGEDTSSWSWRSPCRAGRGVKAGLQPGHLCTSRFIS